MRDRDRNTQRNGKQPLKRRGNAKWRRRAKEAKSIARKNTPREYMYIKSKCVWFYGKKAFSPKWTGEWDFVLVNTFQLKCTIMEIMLNNTNNAANKKKIGLSNGIKRAREKNNTHTTIMWSENKDRSALSVRRIHIVPYNNLMYNDLRWGAFLKWFRREKKKPITLNVIVWLPLMEKRNPTLKYTDQVNTLTDSHKMAMRKYWMVDQLDGIMRFFFSLLLLSGFECRSIER